MKTLLTGATGFVGAAILRRLASEDADVRVLVRESSNRQNIEGFRTEVIVGDLNDRASLQRASKGCRYLIHAAADYRIWTKDPQSMIDTNVKGTENIMVAAAEAGVERIVYTSSVAALGVPSKNQPGDETLPSTLGDKIGPYKQSKYQAENCVIRLFEQQQLPVVIVNPAAPIGPGDIKPTPTGRLVVEAARGKVPAFVNSGLCVVHVDDVAQGHMLALRAGQLGEKYILGGENVSLLQLLTWVAQCTGRKPPKIQIPHNLVLPIAYASEIWARFVSGKEPFTTVDGVRMSKKHMYYSSAKAKRELGYNPRAAKEAIADAVDWFARKGYLH